MMALLLALAATPAGPTAQAGEGPTPEDLTPELSPRVVFPVQVTAYDVATPQELFYRRHIAPTIAGNTVGEWSVLAGLEDQLGAWINPFVEASQIATTIAESFPIGSQEPTRDLDELVGQCARVLHLKKPDVFIRNSPFTACYVTEIDGRPMLTLTSGLLSLYEGRPGELRFVVGRELGRVKCGHLGQWAKAYAVFVALQSVNLAVVPDEYQLALPTLALGRLMSALREMEFSADRAGLLCCQDTGVAFQAMFRNLHGLKAASTWIDPAEPDFDPQVYLKAIEYWENKPLVRFVQEVKQYSSQSPFVPERIAQLAVWADSPAYREILGRTAESAGPDQLVTVTELTVRNVADESDGIAPYVVAYSGGRKLFQTSAAEDLKSVRWRGVDQTRRILDGQPIFFEIWSDDRLSDAFLGGFVVYPKKSRSDPRSGQGDLQVLRAAIDWDWKERVATSRLGVATVTITYSTRAKEKK